MKGADVFDLAIAPTALRSGVNVVYTFDARVVSRIPDLEVREPGQR